jgi:hypothetical protein
MSKIKIIPEAVKPMVPKNKNLNQTEPRFRAPGGKPPLQLEKSYNRAGGFNEKEPKTRG